MPDPSWIKKTVITSLIFALPALILLINLWWGRSRRPDAGKVSLAFWIGVAVLVLYVMSLVNIVLSWSVIYMLVWPLTGIVLSVFGCGLAFSSDQVARVKLISANALLLVLSLASIVAPN
jgi:hypothetical protein